MTERQRLLARFGYLAPAVSVSFVFLATVLDPKFSWRSRSLSSVGEATGQSLFVLTLDQIAFNLFNAGLFLTGILGLPFVVALWYDAEDRLHRAGLVFLTLTLLGTTGVGVSYIDGPFEAFHFPFAFTFFLGVALTIWTYNTGTIRQTDAERGLGFMWAANLYAIVWVFWIILEALVFTGDGDTWTWFAVPEFVAAVLLGGWIALQARRLLTDDTALTD